jgi:hypothetical protein
MRTGCFMNIHLSGDIRCGLYLWVYFAAKILGVMVISGAFSPLTARFWRRFPGTGIIFREGDLTGIDNQIKRNPVYIFPPGECTVLAGRR